MASKFYNNESYNDELRIVMLGKTGAGKSASGNTILGQKCFESKFSAKSITVNCSKNIAEVNGQKVVVIDTPGLFDTRFGIDKTAQEISRCISYSAPGPHVFLVVIRLDRFTEEEKKTVNKIKEVFGRDADKYSMVLFTHSDFLQDTTFDKFLNGSLELQELVARCNGLYHVFSNRVENHSQVTELLQKIRNIVQRNGGSHYTNEMFQKAEIAVEKEKQCILKEQEGKIHREQEELEKKLQRVYENEKKRMYEHFQAERERERKEREKERKREREEWNKERKREREEREAERRREREEEKREIETMITELNVNYSKNLKWEREMLRNKYEMQARRQAENSSGLLLLPLVLSLFFGCSPCTC